MTTARRALRLAIPCLIALALLVGCAPDPRLRYIPDGGTYSSDEALQKGREVDIGTPGFAAEDASRARERALASLRSIDSSASAFAALMTRTFPRDTASVPLYAEAATVDGGPAWIVVEAWGGRTGRLERRRIWVLADPSGDVIASATAE